MPPPALLAVDVGSTAVKAAVFSVEGLMLGEGSKAQRTISDVVGWREQDPQEVWIACTSAIRDAIDQSDAGSAIGAIVVTSTRGTFGVIDSDGRALTRFITWQDSRFADLLEVMHDVVAEDSYSQITGMAFDESAALPKLLWLRQHDPGALSGARWLVTPQGDALRRLGAGAPHIGTSIASHIGLFDIRLSAWSEHLIGAFGIPAHLLPPVSPPGTVVGSLDSHIAKMLGLRADLPLIVTGANGTCGDLGAGVISEDQLYGSLGTGSGVAGPIDSLRIATGLGVTTAPGSVLGRWRLGTLGFAGSSALDWMGRILGAPWREEVELKLHRSPPGARGALFIPTLAGAAVPLHSAYARGLFLGLSLTHEAADLARAVLEGVALEMRWMVEALREAGLTPAELRLAGGGSRLDGWCQIHADVQGLPILRIKNPNPTLRGAACYAATELGFYASPIEAAASWPCTTDRFEPRPEFSDRYKAMAEIYRDILSSVQTAGLDQRVFALGSESARQEEAIRPGQGAG